MYEIYKVDWIESKMIMPMSAPKFKKTVDKKLKLLHKSKAQINELRPFRGVRARETRKAYLLFIMFVAIKTDDTSPKMYPFR